MDRDISFYPIFLGFVRSIPPLEIERDSKGLLKEFLLVGDFNPTQPPNWSEVFFLGLLGEIASGCGSSNSCARIECSEMYFSHCLSTVFFRMQTHSPINSGSPNFVEIVRIKLLLLVWCLLCHYSI